MSTSETTNMVLESWGQCPEAEDLKAKAQAEWRDGGDDDPPAAAMAVA